MFCDRAHLGNPCFNFVDHLVGSTGQQLDEVPTCCCYRQVFVHQDPKGTGGGNLFTLGKVGGDVFCNFEVELRRAAEKLENGMSGFLTQPVLSAQAVENLKKARETLGERAKILAGILPVVSQRNAIFMENEVNGIHVDDAIIQRFEGLDRAAGEELGLEVSVQAAKAAAPYADGFYLMTPFNRVALMERLIARLRTEVTG